MPRFSSAELQDAYEAGYARAHFEGRGGDTGGPPNFDNWYEAKMQAQIRELHGDKDAR